MQCRSYKFFVPTNTAKYIQKLSDIWVNEVVSA